MREIHMQLQGYSLKKTRGIAGVQGEGNATALLLTFGPDWDGLSKKLTWINALGQNPVVRTLTADLLVDLAGSTRSYRTTIPPEPLEHPGACTLVVDGYQDGVRARSVPVRLGVEAAPVVEGGTPADPTPTQAEQLQTQIDTLLGDMADQAEMAQGAAETATQSAQGVREAAQATAEHAATAQGAAEHAQTAAEHAQDAAEHAQAAAGLATQLPEGEKDAPAEEDFLVLMDSQEEQRMKLTRWGGVLGTLAEEFAPLLHGHAIEDVTGLSTSLAEKAVLKPMHAIPDGSDLNDYIEIGDYGMSSHTTAASLINAPFTNAFRLQVEASLIREANEYMFQTATVYNGERQIRTYNKFANPQWTAWTHIVMATPPKEYDLPLVSGVTAYRKCKYSKDQFGRVTMNMAIKVGSATLSGSTVANLPSGYRPPFAVEVPVAIGTLRGTVFIANTGPVLIYCSSTIAENSQCFLPTTSFLTTEQ